CPTIGARVVSPACIKNARVVSPAPDNHFIAGPDCRVNISASGRVGGAGGCPTIGAGVVSPAGVEIRKVIIFSPDNHFFAGFHCRSRLPCERTGLRARRWCWWLSKYQECIRSPYPISWEACI